MTAIINASNTSGITFTSDTSGNLALQSNGTTALTVSGDSVTAAANLSFNSGYGSSSLAYGCRAWISFNGSGTPAIRASGNINSITDNGTGDYSINFTNALVDANYSVTGMASDTGGVGNRGLVSLYRGVSAPNTSSFRVFTFTDTTQTDNTYIYLSVFR